MKRLGIVLAFAALAACGPTKFKEEVRQVQVGNTSVDEDMGTLSVELMDIDSKQIWNVDLGEECRQYPLPAGEKFMTRFDVMKYEDKPEIYYAPQVSPVWKYLCG